MRKQAGFVLVSAIIAVAASPYLGGQPAGGGKAGKTDNPDAAAVKKAGQSFIKAFLAGDAKAMAAHWTENGEYFADDGTVLHGRAKIEKAYTDMYAKKQPPTEAEVEITSLRFPSKDTAIEEGYFKVRKGKEAPVTSKYSILHVREGGKWLMAIVREWPSDGVSVRDLEWLIGTWEAKRNDIEVHSTYEWWGDKAFLRCTISIKHKGKAHDGFQMIGKDLSTGQIRSWSFDMHGAFGEATWTREGAKWIQESAGVLDDGNVLVATNILTRIDNDAFTFQSVHRSVDGEALEDIPVVRVTRVKSK